MSIVKKILISQSEPLNPAPYTSLKESYGVEIDFKPFFVVEPLTSREFRAQRINILDYTAVVFSSRHAINAYFQICEDLRIKVPETMKYFCTSEIVAMYLQKHIVYRKRKIFFGDGTAQSIIAQIGTKHSSENFLIVTSSDSSNGDAMSRLFESKNLSHKCAAFIKSVSQDLKEVDLKSYDMMVLYNPSDVKSLFESYPDYKQDETLFVAYGKSIVNSMEEAGLKIEIKAPTAEAPSVAKAIELYLKNQ